MLKTFVRRYLVKMPSYRVPIEDEVFRSMKVDNFSKTPYSDATQVGYIILINIDKCIQYFMNETRKRIINVKHFCSL